MTRIIWKKIREEVRGILLSRPFVSSPSSLPTTRRLRATRATTGSIRQRTAYRPSRDLEAHESYNVALLCDDRYECPRRGMASGVPRLGSVSRSFTRQPRRRLLELPLAGGKHRCVCHQERHSSAFSNACAVCEKEIGKSASDIFRSLSCSPHFLIPRMLHGLRPTHLSDLLPQLILPYVQLDIKYYDLGLEHRDAVRPNPCLLPFPLCLIPTPRPGPS